jgi:3-hydroxybutyryl-CoA dehydrogenase
MLDAKVLGVIGAGQMGAGIAQVAAQAGLKVLLRDQSPDIVDRALQGISRQLQKQVEKRITTPRSGASRARSTSPTSARPM